MKVKIQQKLVETIETVIDKSDIKKEVPDEQNSQKEDNSEGVANTVIVGL